MQAKMSSLIAHIKGYQSYFPKEFLDVVIGDKIYDEKYIPIQKFLKHYLLLEHENRAKSKTLC